MRFSSVVSGAVGFFMITPIRVRTEDVGRSGRATSPAIPPRVWGPPTLTRVIRMHRKFVIGFIGLVVVLTAVSTAFHVSDSEYETHGGMEWRTDFEVAQQVAAEEGQPILMYFWMENCLTCEQFESRLERGDLDHLFEKYVLVSVDLSARQEFAGRYGVSKTPELIVVTADGTKLDRIVPPRTRSLRASLKRAYANWSAQQ